jgi:hypothetical protein
LCLETHKHMGTTFQGTQSSTYSSWMGQIDSLSLLRSCALTLNKCALVVATCVTIAKDRWKICVISPVTRVCLSTPKSTSGCVDRSFSTEVNSHIIKIIYVEDSRVLPGVFKHQHLYSCKRDLRAPARVIM